MTRAIRRKIIIQQIANKLDKYDRRIQKMAENAYKLRQFLATLHQQENEENALYNSGSEGTTGAETTNQDTGESDVLAPTNNQAVLGQ